MNITQEQTGNLSLTLKLEIHPEDYQSGVDKAIREYQKKAAIPGFRPGKVPMGMVKKMVGSEVLAEELNKLISDNLYKYLEDNKIEYFAEPMPNTDNQASLENAKDGIFEFCFDLALKPKIECDIEKDLKVPFYSIEVSEREIDDMVDRYRMRGAEETSVDVAELNDKLAVALTETDVYGNHIPDGLNFTSSLTINKKLNEDEIQKFIGLKINATINIVPSTLISDENVLSQFMSEETNLEKSSSHFELKVESISRSIPRELNEDFFKEVFPEDEIIDELGFRSKIRGFYESYRKQDAEVVFYRDTINSLIDKLNIELPEELLKKRLVETAHKEKRDPQQYLNEYPLYARALKEQLIESYLGEKYEIKVEYPEVREEVLRSIGIPDIPNPSEEILKTIDNMVSKALSEESQAIRYYEGVFKRKLGQLFDEKVEKEMKSISFEDFIKLDSAQH